MVLCPGIYNILNRELLLIYFMGYGALAVGK